MQKMTVLVVFHFNFLHHIVVHIDGFSRVKHHQQSNDEVFIAVIMNHMVKFYSVEMPTDLAAVCLFEHGKRFFSAIFSKFVERAGGLKIIKHIRTDGNDTNFGGQYASTQRICT